VELRVVVATVAEEFAYDLIYEVVIVECLHALFCAYSCYRL
jgi:hypothetical protein